MQLVSTETLETLTAGSKNLNHLANRCAKTFRAKADLHAKMIKIKKRGKLVEFLPKN
jgi:hypothetical protein